MDRSTPWGPRGRRPGGRRAATPLAPAVLVLVLATAPAALAAGEGEEEPGAAEAPPRVELEKLLELPASRDYSVERRGGATAGEWRARFQRVREALAEERRALEEARAELEEQPRSGQAWNMGPALPGGGAAAGEAPLDYALRQRIRRHRDEIERLERKLRELQVEANLAGVPSEWREGEPQAARSDGDGPTGP